MVVVVDRLARAGFRGPGCALRESLPDTPRARKADMGQVRELDISRISDSLALFRIRTFDGHTS